MEGQAAPASEDAPLRVCLVVPYDIADEGGVKRHAFHLAESLRKMRDLVTIIAPLSRGEVPEGVRGFGGVVNVPANGADNRMSLFPSPWAVRRFFLESDFDLVHIHEPLVPLLSYHALWFSPRAAHVATFHMYAEGESRASGVVRRLASGLTYHRFERAIAVSKPAAEYAAQVWRRPIEVIPNGVPTSVFVPPANDQAGTSPEGPLRVLFVGNWRDPRKGLRHLMEAHRILLASGTDVRVDVVGAGDGEAPAGPGVAFHGPVSSEVALAGWYRECDVFVAPSTGQEAFGIVLIEAMASGKPVVCSDIAGYRQVAEPEGAILVPPGDPQELARALSVLARDPERRRRMGELNRKCAEAFDWDRIVGRVRAQYVAALDEKRGTRTTV